MRRKCLDERSAGMFLENEGLPREKRRIAAHLETCPRCRELLKELEKEDARLKEIFAIPTALGSPDLLPRVMKEMEAVDLPRGRFQSRKADFFHLSKRGWAWATAASILLSVLLAILVLLPGNRPPQEAPEENVILCYARVEGQEVESHIYNDKEPAIQFIWLEKAK